MLGFYPLDEGRDGTWHSLKVSLNRRGVRLRYRENHFAGRESDLARDRPSLEQLVKQPLDAAQVELTAQMAPDPARSGFVQVRVNVDLHDVDLEERNGRRSGEIDLSFFATGTGRLVTKTLKIDIPDDQLAGFLGQGIDAVESIDAPKGDEAVRVIVQDRMNGAAGSVTIPAVELRSVVVG